MIRFTVPGPVRGKGAPRTRVMGKFATIYTDRKTATYENLVRLCAKEAMGSRLPIDEPVYVALRVRITPPASTSKTKRAAMIAGEIRPGKKPDASNAAKSVEDGCSKIVFTDDALVVDLHVRKIYAETEGVDVFVRLANLETGAQ